MTSAQTSEPTAAETAAETVAAAGAAGADAEARPPGAPPPKITPPLAAYALAARVGGPILARAVLRRRARRGKEDPDRLPERLGRASLPRPDGPLVWLHAASVGESLSLLPLAEALRARRPDVTLLVTTGTRTSAALMAERLPDGAIHQYAPVDVVPALRRFVAHWRPSLLAIVESEIWPTMLAEARRAGVPAMLLSARMSARSAQGWTRAPRSIAALLAQFEILLAQTPEIAQRLAGLGAPPERLRIGGALKDAAAPLPADPQALETWRTRLAGRPAWLAASTHPGEETAAIAAHQALAARRPGLLTIVAPRHPERADAVAVEIAAAGLPLARRSDGDQALGALDGGGVLLVDRLGELGLWYRLAPAAFVGGSLSDIGGHNPLEPARLGAAILFGPDMANFSSERARLVAAGGAIETTAEGLAHALEGLLDGTGAATPAAAKMAAAAARVADEGGTSALERHLDAALSLLGAP